MRAASSSAGAQSGMNTLGNSSTARSPGQSPSPLRIAASKRPPARSYGSGDRAYEFGEWERWIGLAGIHNP